MKDHHCYLKPYERLNGNSVLVLPPRERPVMRVHVGPVSMHSFSSPTPVNGHLRRSKNIKDSVLKLETVWMSKWQFGNSYAAERATSDEWMLAPPFSSWTPMKAHRSSTPLSRNHVNSTKTCMPLRLHLYVGGETRCHCILSLFVLIVPDGLRSPCCIPCVPL